MKSMDTQIKEIRGHEALMTEKEMAAYLRIKPRQLFNWRADGLVPFIRIGRAIRYRRGAVDAAIEAMSSAFGPI
jgi:excisionase family DNA binding protein